MRSHGFSAANNANVKGVDNYRYRTPAVFLQAYRTYLEDRLELNGSIRLDRHNVFGSIASPRLNALYHHTDEVSSRFSIGRGFRAPTSFFEQDHGILDDIRIIRMLDKPGKSDNLSYALSYADERLAVTSSYNYNRIHHMATLTPGVADPAGSTPCSRIRRIQSRCKAWISICPTSLRRAPWSASAASAFIMRLRPAR
ncbi:hypothetical protein MTYP_02696 [Methylophilaceae bacterium]|nr:hypothetical protein MTYP_02696 [Methylophilaceae bacterium]